MIRKEAKSYIKQKAKVLIMYENGNYEAKSESYGK